MITFNEFLKEDGEGASAPSGDSSSSVSSGTTSADIASVDCKLNGIQPVKRKIKNKSLRKKISHDDIENGMLK